MEGSNKGGLKTAAMLIGGAMWKLCTGSPDDPDSVPARVQWAHPGTSMLVRVGKLPATA